MTTTVLVCVASGARAHPADHTHDAHPPKIPPRHERDDRAQRAPERPFARNGGYVGIGVALQPENFDTSSSEFPFGSAVDNSFGFNTRVGARFSPYLAAELQYEWIDGFDISIFGVDEFQVDGWTLTGNLKILFSPRRVQPYALLGTGVMKAKRKDLLNIIPANADTEFAARFGGGMDIYVNESVALNFEISHVVPSGDIEDFNYTSVGWGVLFVF